MRKFRTATSSNLFRVWKEIFDIGQKMNGYEKFVVFSLALLVGMQLKIVMGDTIKEELDEASAGWR